MTKARPGEGLLRKAFQFSLVLLLLFFTERMVRITLPYLAFRDDVDFLLIKQSVVHLRAWKASFYVHVLTSVLLPLAGLSQFSRSFLAKHPRAHKIIGRAYAGIILLFSGPASLIISLLANGGWTSRAGFTILSVLWIGSTYQAYASARKRDFPRHSDFMIRSYALTLSALTLRGWKFLLVHALRPNPMDAYRIVVWLGWVPNLLLAEYMILKKEPKRAGHPGLIWPGKNYRARPQEKNLGVDNRTK